MQEKKLYKGVLRVHNDSKIFVAGHRGLVGAAIMRRLKMSGYSNVVTRTHLELDLLNFQEVESFFENERPEYVFLAAAKVGGILANQIYPADFITKNLQIQTNVIELAHRYEVRKLLFLGSSCIYPKFSPQPIKEEYLLTGPLEPTNEAYAVAKIAGIKMCEAYLHQFGDQFISVMPTNLYGPGDNFDLESSHVLPALIRKFHEAKVAGFSEVKVWGTGQVKREFLHVDDMADACVLLMDKKLDYHLINIGTGKDISIQELATMIADEIKFEGKIMYDEGKPEGTPRKLLDISKLTELGWKPSTTLRDGIASTYRWFINNIHC